MRPACGRRPHRPSFFQTRLDFALDAFDDPAERPLLAADTWMKQILVVMAYADMDAQSIRTG